MMVSEKRKRPPNFRIEIHGNDEVKNQIQEKLRKVKGELTAILNKPVNNANIITEGLEFFFIKQHDGKDSVHEKQSFPSMHVQVMRKGVNQKLFVTAEQS